MREIEWYDTYELGFPELDRDHRQLFDIANSVIRALHDGDHTACKRQAGCFIEALKQHFPREEKFLAKIGYPGLEKHAGYHRQLLQRAEQFVEHLDSETREEILSEPITELVSVLVADLRGGDLMFRTFLRDKGLDDAVKRHGSIWL